MLTISSKFSFVKESGPFIAIIIKWLCVVLDRRFRSLVFIVFIAEKLAQLKQCSPKGREK